MPEWDDLNRPKGYVISVTPGFAQYGQGDERLIYMGLARKITKAARLGFEFAEIDFEALSEMFEPEIAQQVASIKDRQGIEVGLHLPVSMDLCLAHAYQWKFMHRQLKYGAVAGAERMKAKFILFHTSSMARPAISAGVGERTGPTKMAAWNGVNLGNWIEEASKGHFDLKDWFMAKFIDVMFRAMGVAGDPGVISFMAEEVAIDRKEGFNGGQKFARTELQKIYDGIVGPAMREMDAKIEKLRNDAVVLSREISEIQAMTQKRPELGREAHDIQEQIKLWETEKSKAEKASDMVSAKSIENQLENLKKKLNSINQELNLIERNLQTLPNKQQQLNQISIEISNLQDREIRERKTRDILMASKWNGRNAWERFRQLRGVISYLDHYNFEEIYRYWTIHGSECEEPIAYHVVAKWMFRNEDRLYKDIVTASKDDLDIIIYKANTDPHAAPSVIEAVKQIITAVAAKYIEGHLIASDPKEYAVPVDKNGRFIVNENMAKNHLSIFEYCKKHRLHVFIETNMPGTQEAGHGGGAPPGELRIIKATDHIKMVKKIDPENLSYCMDFEHLLTNYVDPEAEADELAKAGKGDGKYIRCLHTNAPRPVAGAHGPIFPISNDMYILYRYLLKLRKAGCKDAYIIWEMGSYGVRESAIAYRRLVTELLKDTEPDKLPEEFFGIDEVFKALQRTAIKEHAWDPLEGMLQIPEETHTFLGKAAVDKGRGEVWKKERFR